jgi:molecular chaperone GrpE
VSDELDTQVEPEAEAQGAGGADTPPVDPAPEPEPEPDPDPLAEAEARAAEYLALAQRKQAEFENFRKRMSAQSAQAEARGVAKVAKELLAPLDHLGLAIEHADEATRVPLEATRNEFFAALGRLGVEAFSPMGEVFDPNQHEAMAQAPVEGAESGTVTEVYQAGYRLNETILRPARVVVAA